jgi:hypothetical protein
MNLLIITCLKEYLPAVTALIRQAQVAVFSVSRTTGVKTADGISVLDDWFGSNSGDFDSLVVFSFTAEEAAGKVLALVEDYNRVNDSGFPVRAFILPVDKAG